MHHYLQHEGCKENCRVVKIFESLWIASVQSRPSQSRKKSPEVAGSNTAAENIRVLSGSSSVLISHELNEIRVPFSPT